MAGLFLLLPGINNLFCQTNEHFTFSWSEQRFQNQNGEIRCFIKGIAQPLVGSGFVFGSNNDVVTCKHVLDIAEGMAQTSNLVYIASDNIIYILKQKLILTNYDIAVFSTVPKMTNTDPFVMGDFKKLTNSSGLAYIGFDIRQNHRVIAASSVSFKGTDEVNGSHVDYIDFPSIAIPGYSGGGVFNSKGEIIGIICLRIPKADGTLVTRAKSINVLSNLCKSTDLSQRQ